MSTNRHPVDELADVRAAIRRLEEIEARIKETVGAMMGDADSLGGDEWIARQRLVPRKGSWDSGKLAAFLEACGEPEADYRKPDTLTWRIDLVRREDEPDA